MINAPQNSSSLARLDGYKKALKEYGLKELVITADSALGGVREILTGAVNNGIKFDAIFAFSDLLAFEIICVLNELGINVPEDIGIVGFDDIQSRISIPFPLTTICIPKNEWGTKAVNKLIQRINGDMTGFPTKEVLKTKLIIRGSTR